jgi:3,4-dihydroxy 2-butanone 4-phosphate synthase/GTP cyclohydrolase II
MAGCSPASVICEVMNEDGTMARLPDLQLFAAQHGLKIGTIADLIEYRSRNESLVERLAKRPIETPWGAFDLISYRDLTDGSLHLSLVFGQIDSKSETLVRVHEPLSVIDLLDSGQGTHSWSIGDALKAIRKAGSGVMVLMNCSQAGEALEARLEGQKNPSATRPARSMDLRLYGIGAQILRDLGVRRMRLMAAPRKMPSMAGFGLEVIGYLGSPAGR